jgi:hypothetical protein
VVRSGRVKNPSSGMKIIQYFTRLGNARENSLTML